MKTNEELFEEWVKPIEVGQYKETLRNPFLAACEIKDKDFEPRIGDEVRGVLARIDGGPTKRIYNLEKENAKLKEQVDNANEVIRDLRSFSESIIKGRLLFGVGAGSEVLEKHRGYLKQLEDKQ